MTLCGADHAIWVILEGSGETTAASEVLKYWLGRCSELLYI